MFKKINMLLVHVTESTNLSKLGGVFHSPVYIRKDNMATIAEDIQAGYVWYVP